MTRGDDRRDPLIALRIPPSLDEQLRAEATSTGSTLSEIVRNAIEHRFQPEPSPAPSRPASARPTPPTRTRESGKCEHRVRVGSYCRKCDRVVV